MNRSDEDEEAAGHSEKPGIRLTMHGIRASLTPGEIGESAPESWAEVRTKVNRYLMRATVHVFGLLNDVLDGTRRLIRGTCAIPSEAGRWPTASQLINKALADNEAELNDRVYRLFRLTPAKIEFLQREVEH